MAILLLSAGLGCDEGGGGEGPEPTPQPWRSALYPEDWTPELTDGEGRFLHDFSYAGYHRSEVTLPAIHPGAVADVTDFGALPDAMADSAPAFAAAIAAVAGSGGGTVYVPDGEYVLDANLLVGSSGIRIRGQSREGTRLHFTRSNAAGESSLTFAGTADSGGPGVALIANGVARSHAIEVADASSFGIGDDVLVEFVITQAFIDEHAMAGLWDSGGNSALGLRKVFFRREVMAIAQTAAGALLTLDVPLRSAVRVSDGATVRLDSGALSECGVERLSINNAIAPAEAAGNPRAHALGFDHVKDCFVRDVGSYASSLAPDTVNHLQSGGIVVESSKRVTVAESAIGHSQNHGGGGAGYGFEASMSNEILFRDVQVEDVRHGFIQNWDFGSSGLVWLRCEADGDVADNGILVPGRSEFHHRLSMASLFDGCRDTAGFAAYNRRAESSNSGHAATENVFWNVSGAGSETRLSSYQFGFGYVIGTHDLTPLVVPDALDELLGYATDTAPVDHLEGEDRGESLLPSSLFDDQLARRLAP